MGVIQECQLGRTANQTDDQAQKQKRLRQEFRTFLKYWMRIPHQALSTGHRMVLRVLARNEWQPMFFRLAESLPHPLRL